MDNPRNTGYFWVNRTVKGSPPVSRQGHSLAVVGKTAYIFGGSSCNVYGNEEEHHSAPVFFNDLFSLKLIDQHVSWERVKQTGDVPSPRDGHTMCCVGSSFYLFGGTDNPEGDMSLDGLYCFNTGCQKWESCLVQGIQPSTLGHSAAAIEKSVYVFGGICKGLAKNSMYMLNTDNLTWTPLLTSGNPPAPRCDHSCAVVAGEKFYIMGGTGGEHVWFNDMHCFDTATLQWRKILTEGIPPQPRCFHTFTAHHQKDIYLFGGCNDSLQKKSVFSDLYKFSIASSKWKKPNTSGTSPEKRFGHTACFIYGQLIIFGGMNCQTDFNDLCFLQTRAAIKYLNREQAGSPADSLLSSLRYSTTKGPNLSFVLENIPATYKPVFPNGPSKTTEVDLGDLKQEVTGKLEEIFENIKIKFDQLEIEKETLRNAVEAFKEEREQHMQQYDNHQKELNVMVENHKRQTEEWIKNECEQMDEEKRKLAAERAELVEARQQLRKEQDLLLDNSKRLEEIRKIGNMSEIHRTNGDS